MDSTAKILIGLGIFFLITGIAWQFGWLQAMKIGRLPGDILIERENFKFYFPLTTCILISGIVMLIRWLLGKIVDL